MRQSTKDEDPQPRRDAKHVFETDPNKIGGIQALYNNTEGFIVGRHGNQLLRLKTDIHMMTIAPTGAGKGVGTIIPNVLEHKGSIFVIDIRGETVEATANIKRLQGHNVVILDPLDVTKGRYGTSDSFNPLDCLIAGINTREFDSDIKRFANTFLFNPKAGDEKKAEQLWDESTIDYIHGVIRYVLKYRPKNDQNLMEIYRILVLYGKELDLFVNEIEILIAHDSEGKEDLKLRNLLSILTDQKTKIGANAKVMAKIYFGWVVDEAFRDRIVHSTFSFENFQNTPTVVYLVIKDKYVDSLAIWVRTILESAVFSLKDVKQLKGISTHELPHNERVLFLLDETPLFGKLDIVDRIMPTIRGVGANLWLFFQNIGQVKTIYGTNMPTILSNTAVIQAFENDEVEELEYFARVIGEEFHDVETVTIQESITKGKSVTNSHAHQVGNSHSIANTVGSSDTTGESNSVNWSHVIGSNWSEAETKSKSKNKQQGKQSNSGRSRGGQKNKNTNKSRGSTSQRNFFGGVPFSESRNRGNSKGQGEGSSWQTNASDGITSSQGESESSGTTKGKGGLDSDAKGGSNTKNATHAKNESQTGTNTQNESHTDTHSESENESYTVGRNVSVRPERMKIDTVRTLREKLANRSQLLKLRNQQPFFTPRMSFFVKFLDRDRYMFPDIAVLADISKLDELVNRPVLDNKNNELITQIQGLIEQVQEALDYSSYAQRKYENNEDVKYLQLCIDSYVSLISSLPSLSKSYSQIVKQYMNRVKALDEISIALFSLFELLERNLEADYWREEKEDLINRMAELENLSGNLLLSEEKQQSYEQLPLMESIKKKDTLFGQKDEVQDISWLAKTYSSPINTLSGLLKVNFTLLEINLEDLSEMGEWLSIRLKRTQHYFFQALEIIDERKNDQKEKEFFDSLDEEESF